MDNLNIIDVCGIFAPTTNNSAQTQLFDFRKPRQVYRVSQKFKLRLCVGINNDRRVVGFRDFVELSCVERLLNIKDNAKCR